ncbi:hypothetical protein OIDMADRAFT_50558 [Oidiodendron maius Zn]|uniref:G-protein coupled receptors family 2 profile 2 domain-containing protein n=1 Tax=Oidiodendron maius (strain Zn) TaxID=913774 RepID=A0A0C3H900_OIDMZ|nr:hypothetical protein OIDMADRAFT_50558 [Oidiodendron maius Zn]
MSNETDPLASLRGGCPIPFFGEAQFPTTGGFVDGRFCSAAAGQICCLPCPQTEWLYPSNFDPMTTVMDWINVAGMICTVFLLLSFAFLPVKKTHRHYLSVCLAVAIGLMQLGFIVPLGAKPKQCFNEITPNDMHSSRTCAISGAFLLFGGWGAVMWVCMRSVALHLQICWQMVLGNSFMWGALAVGWGVPAIGIVFALVFSGVSFRFGDTCHINHKDSLADFWIPLLVFSGLTLIIQFITFGYCIKVYLASLSDNSATTGSSGLNSYSNSVRGTITPGQAYRRVRRVIQLQWRGIAIVLLVVADVIFFSVVFVFMDDVEQNLLRNPVKAQPWLGCLLETKGDVDQCTHFAQALVMNEPTIVAVLLLLSLNGIWCLVFFGRLSMFTGWYEKARGRREPANIEFVSAGARNFEDPGTYEMLGRARDTGKTPEPVTTQISSLSPTAKGGRVTPDYFGQEARYKSPSRSFSSPQPPNTISRDWDPSQSYAAPGQYHNPLGMHKV